MGRAEGGANLVGARERGGGTEKRETGHWLRPKDRRLLLDTVEGVGCNDPPRGFYGTCYGDS